jgi:photosystem II stability/assembly factor-like uncharacterized protein
MQRSAGLGGRDIFALKQAGTGTLVAGTNRGMFALDRNATQWRPMNAVVVEQTVKTAKKGSKKATTTTVTKKAGDLDARVNDLELGAQRWYTATTAGIYSSSDQGKTWKGGPVLGQREFVSVRAQGSFMVAATRSTAFVSNDSGANWKQTGLPNYLVGIRGSALTADNAIVIAAREGIFRSDDGGKSWEHVVNGLPSKDLTSVSFDASRKRLLVTSDSTGVIFVSNDSGRSWQRGPDTGFPLRRVSVVGGRFVAATPFDGVVLEPEDGSTSAAADAGGSK